MNNLIRSELRKQRTVRLSPIAASPPPPPPGALTAHRPHHPPPATTATPPLAHRSLTQLVHRPLAVVAGGAARCSASSACPASSATTRSRPPCSSHPATVGFLTAKVLVHAGLGALLAVVAATGQPGGRHPLALSRTSPSPGPPIWPRAVAGVAAPPPCSVPPAPVSAPWSPTRTAAVTASLVWLLAVEGLVVSVTSTPTVQRWLPGGALSIVAGGGRGPHAGLQLWAAAGCARSPYAGALIAAGTLRIADRDVT